ncbi:MAG TPA: DUF1513 domain-containing protein [Burkholderiaceae bacterium]|nr:DUF1513 domain-containing protein [Burkholderiaceae bacterium]
MQRRHLLATAAGLLIAPWAARGAEDAGPLALGAAWRGAREDDPQQLGVLEVDWARRRVAVRWSVALPARAHGLVAEPGGNLLAVAMRPGAWLLRCDAQGRVMQRLAIDDEGGAHRFDGHAVPSADGRWLYTTQTDPSGRGWVAVREHASLRKVDQWPTHGVDPHQLLLDARGDVMLANGGIQRTSDGRKRDLDRMASSLVRLDGRSGALRGQWSLPDARLSLRHLAWGRPGEGGDPLLGVALQAEHDDAAQRARAPVLAVWDGRELRVATHAADGAGYAGDIAPAGPGGFALSNHKVRRAFLWWPQQASALHRFAELDEPYALASPERGPDAGAVLLACAAGVARWHPGEAPAMLRWPAPMALDNHWVVMTA